MFTATPGRLHFHRHPSWFRTPLPSSGVHAQIRWPSPGRPALTPCPRFPAGLGIHSSSATPLSTYQTPQTVGGTKAVLLLQAERHLARRLTRRTSVNHAGWAGGRPAAPAARPAGQRADSPVLPRALPCSAAGGEKERGGPLCPDPPYLGTDFVDRKSTRLNSSH